MRKALPFTYASKKKLKDGVRSYWRFRHPKVGEVALRGSPDDERFMWHYKRLLKEAGVRSKVRLRDARARAKGDGQLVFFKVYFIGIEPDGPIKIGFTSSVQSRLKELQCANPQPLKVLATMRGGSEVERAIHRALSEDRIAGEWFARTERLMSFIDDVRTGDFSI